MNQASAMPIGVFCCSGLEGSISLYMNKIGANSYVENESNIGIDTFVLIYACFDLISVVSMALAASSPTTSLT